MDSPAGAPARSLFAWALYDWANSAFATLIQTFVFAAYFTRQVAANETLGTTQWGNVMGVTGVIIAIGGPLLGAVADQAGRRKPWILVFTLVCVVATALLWLVKPSVDYLWPALLLVGLATLGAEFAAIFYNAMLPTLTPAKWVGRWSGWGWALGYAGGLSCLVLALLGFVSEDPWVRLERSSAQHVRATFVLTAIWFLAFSVPLFLATPDSAAAAKTPRQAIRDGLHQLAESLHQIRRYGHIVRFLIARMIYIDGLATLFAFGGVYAAGTFDMDEGAVLAFGIALNVTAGIGAALFAWVDDWIGSKKTILISLMGLITAGSFILLVQSQTLFWILGMFLGIFVGPVQAASRSYLARTAPEDLRNQMFGLFALSGKATAFAGPLLVGWLTYVAGSQRVGMSTIIVFFVAGLLLMFTVPAAKDAPRA